MNGAKFAMFGITEEPATGLPCAHCGAAQQRLSVQKEGAALLVRVADKIETRADLHGLAKLLRMFEASLPAPARRPAVKP